MRHKCQATYGRAVYNPYHPGIINFTTRFWRQHNYAPIRLYVSFQPLISLAARDI
jgi:hypothetical protein